MITLAALKQALAQNEFEFFYQPQLSLISGKLIGAEALIRWRTSEGDLILPDHFIPLAEETGFIREITCHMFDRFVQEVNLIQDLHPNLELSMNFSRLDVDNTALHSKICKAITSKSLNPKKIAIELTETAVIDHLKNDHFSFFKDKGISLVMDDFGSGFANLAALANTPFSKIKLDKSLIEEVLNDKKRYIIVKDNIRMAHRLGMQVVAEGVEYGPVYDFLQNIGCSSIQGYLISSPLALPELIDYLSNDKQIWQGTPIGLLHLAQLDHIEWRKELLDNVFRFDPKKDDKTSLFSETFFDATKCMLGRWYHGEGAIFKGLAEYEAMDEPHQELHLLGHKLILESTKQNRSIERMLDLSRQITQKSIEILRCLHELEHRLITDQKMAQLALEKAVETKTA